MDPILNEEPQELIQTSEVPVVAEQPNNWEQIQEALNQGYSRDEISGYLQSSFDLTPEIADTQLREGVQSKVQQAKEQGYSDEEIKTFLTDSNYDQQLVEEVIPKEQRKPVQSILAGDILDPVEKPPEQIDEVRDIADLYTNVFGKYSTLAKSVGGVFNDKMAVEARQDIVSLNTSIVDKLKEQGFDAFLDPDTGDLMYRNEQGVEQEVDSSFLNDLYNTKTELAGSVGGAIVGGQRGQAIGAAVGLAAGNLTGVGIALPEELITGPIGGAIGRGVGTFIGGALGSGVGKGADLVVNSQILKENLEAEFYVHRMREAAIFDGVATTVGAGVILGSKLGGKFAAKSMMRAYDFVIAGNTQGALKLLKTIPSMSDDQAKEITEQFVAQLNEPLTKNTIFGPKLLNEDETTIVAILSTQQGGEKVLAQAGNENLKLTSSIAKDVNNRAKNLIKVVHDASDKNIGQVVRTDLNKYVKDVKDYFGQVQKIAGKEIDGTDFRFQYDKLAIEPMLKEINKTISDPIKKEQFVLYAERIANASSDRSFSGLLNLRQAVNGFKYGKSNLKTPDLNALNKVINKIDSQIGKAVKEYMPDNGKAWTEQFKKARSEYTSMKKLENNALFKNIQSNAKNESLLQTSLNKYGNDVDVDTEIYNSVIDRLSPYAKAKTEVAAIKNVTKKYTLGNITEDQAIDFPMVSETLKGLNISTKEGKYIQSLFDDYARLFNNDSNLGQLSGKLALVSNGQTIATTWKGKVEMSILNKMWAATRRFFPGQKANASALVNKAEILLENPLNQKAVKSFISKVPKEEQQEMLSLVKQLQIERTKNPVNKSAFKKMFKQSKTGKFTSTKGALGKGVYLVDSVKNPNPASKVIKQEVNMSRMANTEIISNMLGKEVTEKEIRNIPNLQEQLVERGYQGISVDGKVMLFDEQSARKTLDVPLERIRNSGEVK